MKCSNCKQILVGTQKYCANCGQKYIQNLNLKYFWNEFLGNFFNLDSKFFTTLITLVFKPGRLSLEFLKGKRISYIPPVRLYITLSIIFFFLISVGNFNSNEKSSNSDGLEIKSLSIGGKNVRMNTEKYNELILTNELDKYITDSLETENIFLHFFAKKIIKASHNKENFGDTLTQQTSLFLLLFIPFISFFYLITFIKNNYNYINHVVFNIHFNSFVLLLSIMNQIINLFVNLESGILFVSTGTILYLFFGIKYFYLRSNKITIYKMIVLFVGYLLLIIVFSLLLFLVSLIVS